MSKIRKQWVSREELLDTMASSRPPLTTIDAGNVGGLTAGSIPFASATGFLTQDNANLFWDAAEKNLGIGTNVFGATMTQGIQIATGLAPTANVADTFAFYSADFVAGNACPHFRTENGTVIGLNQSLFTTDNVVFGTIGCGTITVANGASINLQEDITFTGATTENLIKFPDNLPDALSFMEGANPYQTFITSNGSEAIQFHEDVLLKASTEYGAGNKTTGAWNKSIGAGGDYADWATMIAAMPDLIAHTSLITIEAGTTLTEICTLRNKHGIASVSLLIYAERYYPTAAVIPTADSATATTLRDAVLAASALGDDYFNGCWVYIVDGTGTDNGYVLITDYIDATGDVVVAAWPGTQPDNTSRYIIVGAIVDAAGARDSCFNITNNTVTIKFKGIGVKGATDVNLRSLYNTNVETYYCGFYDSVNSGILTRTSKRFYCYRSGIVACNTGSNVDSAGLSADQGNMYLEVIECGISDNNLRGILAGTGAFVAHLRNFGDGNGAWGTYVRVSGQAWHWAGSQCSGTSGNIFYEIDTLNPNGDICTTHNIGIGSTTFGTNADKVLAILNGTAPTTSPANMFQMYSADIGGAAGKAGAHFRDEEGNIVSLGTGGILMSAKARVTKCFQFANAALGKGGTKPDEIIVGNYWGWSYDINDDSVFTIKLPDDWASGTDVLIYIRWTINEAYVANSGEVRWQATWVSHPADMNEAINDAGTTDNSGDINIPANAYTLTQTLVETIPAASLAAGDEIGITIKRVALGDGNDPTADPVITCVGLVYTSDKLGTPT